MDPRLPFSTTARCRTSTLPILRQQLCLCKYGRSLKCPRAAREPYNATHGADYAIGLAAAALYRIGRPRRMPDSKDGSDFPSNVQVGRRMPGLSAALAFLCGSLEGAAQADEGSRFQGDGRPSQLPSSFHVDLPGNTDEFQASLTCPAEIVEGVRWPLVIFTGGFGTESAQYTAFAENVAGSGCAVLRYDVSGSMAADDIALVSTLRTLMDWIGSMSQLREFISTENVFLAGHSRGAKLSCLAGIADTRVKGLCLLDPVDNVIWTKGRSGFPSGCEVLHDMQVPVAIVGAGSDSACAPSEANYQQFFQAACSPAWLLSFPAAGHAQFLDSAGMGVVHRAICGIGGADDVAVHRAATATCSSWAKLACGQYNCGCTKAMQSKLDSVVKCAASTHHLSAGESYGIWETPQRDDVLKAAVAAVETVEALQRDGVKVESFLKL